jgi:hypothetical protein
MEAAKFLFLYKQPGSFGGHPCIKDQVEEETRAGMPEE